MRYRAEEKALALARECEKSGVPSMKYVQGRDYAAIGGWNARGIWHFAVETRNDEEKCEVAAWAQAHQ